MCSEQLNGWSPHTPHLALPSLPPATTCANISYLTISSVLVKSFQGFPSGLETPRDFVQHAATNRDNICSSLNHVLSFLYILQDEVRHVAVGWDGDSACHSRLRLHGRSDHGSKQRSAHLAGKLYYCVCVCVCVLSLIHI